MYTSDLGRKIERFTVSNSHSMYTVLNCSSMLQLYKVLDYKSHKNSKKRLEDK